MTALENFDEQAIRRQLDLRGLKKAKEMEASREYVRVRVDYRTVKLVEKNKYEKLYKSNK